MQVASLLSSKDHGWTLLELAVLARGAMTKSMEASSHHGLEDDLRPRIAAAISKGRPFVLVTTYAADGGPRGVGAQMVVTETESWGFVSGGCIEADVAIQARLTLADGEPRHLVYGRGSPWIDLPLPCGGRLDLLAEQIDPDDPVIGEFVAAYFERKHVRYQSDGCRRRCTPASARDGVEWVVDTAYAPPQRLLVVGSDPIALAIAALAGQMGWPAQLVTADSVPDQAPDAWTAIAVATHDMHQDEAAILAALETDAGYIGVLGARRRIADRVEGLRRRGASAEDITRLHMPIGLPIRAAAPWEIAVSVISQIIATKRSTERP